MLYFALQLTSNLGAEKIYRSLERLTGEKFKENIDKILLLCGYDTIRKLH